MKSIKAEYSWLNEVLPEGFPFPTSTLISGPGGTGKPLIELAFVAVWLNNGGSVVGIPLQDPTRKLIKTAMEKLYDVDLEKHQERVSYVQLDPEIDNYEKIEDNVLKANLLKPQVWDEAVEKAASMTEKTDLGNLVFVSALNLLLFSPTYKDKILEHLTDVLANDKSKTYLFSVSTSAFAEDIKAWEEVADNLTFTRMEEPMNLFFRIEKMKGVNYSTEEVDVPVTESSLKEIKKVAETTREKIIPAIRKI